MYKFSVLALSLLLMACSSTPPERMEIETGVDAPEQWNASALEEGKIDSQWWKEFGDDKLNAFVEEAFRQSPTMAAAASRVDRALQQAIIAGADLKPHLSGGLSANRQKSNFNFGSGINSARTTTFGVNLTATWEVDIWGRIRAGQSAAYADLDAEFAAFEGATLSLSAQVVRAYLTAVASRMRVARFTESFENAKLIEKAVARRYEDGNRPRSDVDLVAAARAGAEAGVAAAERGLDYALRQLEILVGRYPKAEAEIAERLPALPNATVPGGIPADIVKRRPDLVLAERRYAAADRRVAEAKANRYPKLSLTASTGTSSDQIKDLLDGDFAIWSLAANLTAPIFDGGRLKARAESSKATREELRANFVRSVLVAWQEVESALASDVYFERQIAAMRETRLRSASALKSADGRYGKGSGDILTVLNARQGLYDAEVNLVAVAAERLDARISLYVALGGGFEGKNIYERKAEDEKATADTSTEIKNTNE